MDSRGLKQKTWRGKKIGNELPGCHLSSAIMEGMQRIEGNTILVGKGEQKTGSLDAAEIRKPCVSQEGES